MTRSIAPSTFMRKLAILVLPSDIEILDRLVRLGFYASRNEAIRAAIRDLIEYHRKAGHL